MGVIFFILNSAFAGVILLNGQPVEPPVSSRQSVSVARPTEKKFPALLVDSRINVRFKDRSYQDSDELQEAGESVVKSIEANLRENICGQYVFSFSPMSCYLPTNSCQISFQSERCQMRGALESCPPGFKNPRFARGPHLEREFKICLQELPQKSVQYQTAPSRGNGP